MSDEAKPPLPKLYTEEDVLKMTGLGRVTLWRLRKAGKLPYRKIGVRIRYGQDDIDAFLENVKVGKKQRQD